MKSSMSTGTSKTHFPFLKLGTLFCPGIPRHISETWVHLIFHFIFIGSYPHTFSISKRKDKIWGTEVFFFAIGDSDLRFLQCVPLFLYPCIYIYSVSTCVPHVFAKLFLNKLCLHKLLRHIVLLRAHCFVSRVEVFQQQRLLCLVSEDANCFQKGHPGNQSLAPRNFYACKPDLI